MAVNVSNVHPVKVLLMFREGFYCSVPLELWFSWSPPGGSSAASGEYWPFPSLCRSQHSSSRTFCFINFSLLDLFINLGLFILFRQLIQSSSNVLTHYLIPKSYKALAIVELLADDWSLIWLLTHLGTFPWGAWAWVEGRWDPHPWESSWHTICRS